MALLHLLSYLGGLAGFLFVTLSLASGLLWIAELIEEHSKHAKTIGMRAIYAVITLHLVLIVTDSLPVLPTLLSITAHLVYLSNFSSSWPYISLTSPRFLASCALVVADHFTWFYHFAAKAKEAKRFRQPKYRYGAGAYNDGPAFMDVAAFFAICVWFVPLFLFLSLSANDNALPSFDASPSQPSSPATGHIDLSTPSGGQTPSHRHTRAQTSTSLVKSILTPVLSLLPRLRSRRKNDEGLIAPRTPVRGSPLHTPVNMPATSYFPWGEEGTAKQTTALLPDSMRVRSRTPPPPRRVQSEAWASNANPRGVASRDGKAVGADDWFADAPGAANPPGETESTGPRMSLGPRANESLQGAEVVVSDGPPRRKAD